MRHQADEGLATPRAGDEPGGFPATTDVPSPKQGGTGVLTFGDAATMPPAPVKLTEQRMRHLEYLPDTALDWLETTAGSIRAVSARGRLHRFSGEVRQDSFALAQDEDALVLIVADGVGGESAGHIGAALAARTAANSRALIARALAHGADPGSIMLSELSAAIEAVGLDRGIPAQAMSTTFTMAVVSPPASATGATTAAIIQLGDSPVWRIRDSAWTRLDAVPEAEADSVLSTSTLALPLHIEASIWSETLSPGDTLALTSDGVGNIIPQNADYAEALGRLWSGSAPAPSDLLSVVDATVRTFEDDRTFVGIRLADRA
jgi:serine/threonine protein phosphatase PrpC